MSIDIPKELEESFKDIFCTELTEAEYNDSLELEALTDE